MSRTFLRSALLQGARDQLEAHRELAESNAPGHLEAKRKVCVYSAAVLVLEMDAAEARAA